MVSTPPVESPTSGLSYLPSIEGSADTRSPNQELFPLTARVNDNDTLEIGGCDVTTLTRRFGTPLYILDETTLRTACRQYRNAFQRYYEGDSLVLFASKAWSCLAVCAIVASEGLGTDVVSGGELYTALKAGVSPDRIYLHGNNKSRQELQRAIDAGITVVADNWNDLNLLVSLTEGRETPVRLMLRLTPGIECHTHEYIQTGHLDSKFGFDPDSLDAVLEFVSQHPSLSCVGLHAHIGSQIFELQPHCDLPKVMVSWWQRAKAYGLPVTELNVGGGLGIRYTQSDDPPSIDAWVKTVCENVTAACREAGMPLPRLLCEPGRSLVGSACVTAYTIGAEKTVPGIRTYITVDGGMSDNPRPITYQSLYQTVVANRMSAPATETVTVAGKHCESGDVVVSNAKLPKTQAGDVLVVAGTGAYNYSMSSNYNRLPRPAAVLVQEGEASIVLQRETDDDLLRQDRLPDRLMGTEDR
ncbi:diaminopimelate decarboxylase [Baaleninema sp.]|uniref:diaminopimelate decarboxylase n=1 Tax=Baaleninema sp. TaxID=3101197 RepID=UPI003D040526